MPDETDALSPPLPAGLSVADALCVQCSYALAGLDAAGVCPECGTPIEHSLRGNRLMLAPAGYIRTLHHGAVLVVIGTAVAVLLLILMWVALMLTSASPVVGGRGGLAWYWFFVGAGFLVVASVVVLFMGYSKLSMPHPGVAGRDAAGRTRLWLRLGTVGLMGIPAAMVVGMSPIMHMEPLSDLLLGQFMGTAMVAIITVFSFSVRMVQHLGALADNRIIARRSRLFLWLCPVLVVFGTLLYAVPSLIGLLLYLHLLNLLRRDLKRIRAQQALLAAPD